MTELDYSLKNYDPDVPLVSVVITTKNEEKNIEYCLESVRHQTWKHLEIIVIDNSSIDATVQIARKYTEKVYIKGPERSAQRNYGMIEQAKGIYVVYLDADMILSQTLIEECVAFIRTSNALALHIAEIVLGNGYICSVRRFERSFYNGTVIDGARFFDRLSFANVGGFDAELFIEGSGEDWDIDKKLREIGKIDLLPDRVTVKNSTSWSLEHFVNKHGVNYNPRFVGIYHNESDFYLLKYLRKKYYYSKGFEGYIRKWGRNDPDILRQFGLLYRYWTVFTERGKWKKLIRRPDLAIGIYCLRIMVGVVYIIFQLRLKYSKKQFS